LAPQEERVIAEVLRICNQMGLKIDTKRPEAENKFLAAWHKSVQATTL